MLAAVGEILDKKEASLKRAWESNYGEKLGMKLDPQSLQASHNLQITNNVTKFYNELPENSVVRTSALGQLLHGVPADAAASYLGIDSRSVYRARENDVKPLCYYLVNLGLPRDRLGEAQDFAIEWCDSLQEPSGKLCKCYFGLFKSMYAEYYAWCVKEMHLHVCPEILDRIRRERRVWLLKGDIFLV